MRVARSAFISIQAGLPTIFVGDFGIGKTSTLYAFSSFLGLEVVRLPLLGAVPEDIVGYPYKYDVVVDGKVIPLTGHATYDKIYRLSQGNCLLLLDEIGRIDQDRLQNVVATILDRKVGQFSIPDNVLIAGTCNTYDIGGQYDINYNVLTRCLWYKCSVDDLEEDMALVSGEYNHNWVKLPDDWRKYIPSAALFLLGFKKTNRTAFKRPDSEILSETFVCPRTLTYAKLALAANFSVGYKTISDIVDTCSASCGSAFGAAIGNYCKSLTLPDTELFINEYLLHELEYEFEVNPVGNLMALFTEVTNYINLITDKDLAMARQIWNMSIKYIDRYIIEDYPEVALFIAHTLLKCNESVRGLLPAKLIELMRRAKS